MLRLHFYYSHTCAQVLIEEQCAPVVHHRDTCPARTVASVPDGACRQSGALRVDTCSVHGHESAARPARCTQTDALPKGSAHLHPHGPSAKDRTQPPALNHTEIQAPIQPATQDKQATMKWTSHRRVWKEPGGGGNLAIEGRFSVQNPTAAKSHRSANKVVLDNLCRLFLRHHETRMSLRTQSETFLF